MQIACLCLPALGRDADIAMTAVLDSHGHRAHGAKSYAGRPIPAVTLLVDGGEFPLRRGPNRPLDSLKGALADRGVRKGVE